MTLDPRPPPAHGTVTAGGWRAERRPAAGPLGMPWASLAEDAPGVEDARAEVLAPAAPLHPLDVVRLTRGGDPAEVETWLVGEDGRTARRLTLDPWADPFNGGEALQQWLQGGRLAGDWVAAWTCAREASWLLGLADLARVRPHRLVAAVLPLARAALGRMDEAAAASADVATEASRWRIALDAVDAWLGGGKPVTAGLDDFARHQDFMRAPLPLDAGRAREAAGMVVRAARAAVLDSPLVVGASARQACARALDAAVEAIPYSYVRPGGPPRRDPAALVAARRAQFDVVRAHLPLPVVLLSAAGAPP